MNPSTFRTNLKTALDADATITSLNAVVYKYPPGDKAALTVTQPIIGINRVTTTSDDGTLLPSSTLDQTYLVDGGVSVKAKGATDAFWTAAESTAYQLLERLQAVAIAGITGATQVRLTRWELEPTAANSFEGDWTLTVRIVA